MPIYEYECDNRHRFELRQSFTDKAVAACPTCDLEARRLFRPVPVHFKGSGFYVNDYGRGSAATSDSNGGESKESPDSGSKESSSSSKVSAGKKSEAEDK